MFENLREHIGIQLTRFQFRHRPDQVLEFTNALSKAKTALVVMPFDTLTTSSTVNLLRTLRTKFKDKNLTLVLGEHNTEIPLEMRHCDILHLYDHELNQIFLPRKTIINRIRRKRYDVAIDLNLDFILPTAYICKASEAKVRIGFVKQHADMFYNFQIQKDARKKPAVTYDFLALCFKMF